MDMDNRRRYFIVGSVIMEVVTPLFRTRLERDYTSKGLPSLQAFLNTQPVIHIMFHLRHRNARCCVDGLNCYNHPSLPLIYCQWKLLYSEKPSHALHDCHCKFTANPVQLEDLDITLSSLILLNCNNLTPSEDAAVQGLRQYKNDYLSHNTTGRISQTEYKSLWTDLTNFVLQLDSSKQDDMIRIEQRPLDESLCYSYTLNLLDLHKKLDEMDNSIQGIRSDIQGLNAYIQEILLYIRKDGCSCQCGNSKQQNITDVVILHAEDDRLLALDFMNNMEAEFPELKLNLKIFEQLNVGKSMFESASLLFETCRFLFVLLTHKFARDDLPRFLNEIALVETITFKDRNCRLIQVLIDGDCRAPELGPIIPLMYNRYLEAKSRGIRDRGFINSFEKLVKNGRKNYLTS